MRKFLLPVKGTLHDKKAAVVVALLARETNGVVTVLHVRSPDATPENLETIAAIKTMIDEIYAVEYRYSEVDPHPDASGAILEEAKKGYDYVVLGARKDDLGESRIVGNTSRFVFQNSPCPVVIVKEVLPGGQVPPMRRSV